MAKGSKGKQGKVSVSLDADQKARLLDECRKEVLRDTGGVYGVILDHKSTGVRAEAKTPGGLRYSDTEFLFDQALKDLVVHVGMGTAK